MTEINLDKIDFRDFLSRDCEDTETVVSNGACWCRISLKLKYKVALNISEAKEIEDLAGFAIKSAAKDIKFI